MSRQANPTAIGAFVVGAAALVVIGLLTFGSLTFLQQPVRVVMFFDNSVNGLSVGAPVSYRGVKVGDVTGISTRVGSKRIAVFANIDRRKLPPGTDPVQGFKRAIEQEGLRAQLGLQSIVTGQLFVSLEFMPDTPVQLTTLDPSLIEIPTVPTELQQWTARIDRVVSAIEKLPLGDLFASSIETVRGVNQLASSPELRRSLQTAGTTLAEAQRLVLALQRESGPLFTSFRDSSDAARQAMKDVSSDLRQLVAKLDATSDRAQALLDDTQKLVKNMDTHVGPLVSNLSNASDSARSALDTAKTALEKAQGTLGTVDRTLGSVDRTLGTFDRALGGESDLGYQLGQTLQQLGVAAHSIRTLADYLDRHPEALLFGKGAPPGAK
jgi:paraquat-inducible protein B